MGKLVNLRAMSARFVHLHIHSDYSLVDSVIRLPDKPEYGDPAKASRPNLISRAVELKSPALALTDQSNLFALVKFYRAAEANGVKPIAGADLWIANPAEPAKPTRLTLLVPEPRRLSQSGAAYLAFVHRRPARRFRDGRSCVVSMAAATDCSRWRAATATSDISSSMTNTMSRSHARANGCVISTIAGISRSRASATPMKRIFSRTRCRSPLQAERPSSRQTMCAFSRVRISRRMKRASASTAAGR